MTARLFMSTLSTAGRGLNDVAEPKPVEQYPNIWVDRWEGAMSMWVSRECRWNGESYVYTGVFR